MYDIAKLRQIIGASQKALTAMQDAYDSMAATVRSARVSAKELASLAKDSRSSSSST
jgi:hypothetical protein